MATQPAVSDVLSSITSDVQTIVRGEIELAKAEIVPQVKKVGIGAGLAGAAGYLALSALTLIYVALSFVLAALYAAVMPLLWAGAAGFGTVALIFLIIAGILLLVAKAKFQVKGPDRAIAEAERAVDAVKTAVDRGQANVASMNTSNARAEIGR